MDGGRARPSVRERSVLTIAATLLALQTLTDVFFAPQRGTRWTDHPAAGLVPLALLAAVTAFYPRLSAGARAVAAAILGVLALETAGLATAAVSRGTARPSDWIALLLWPAGLLLLGLAAITLWRSRKRQGHRYLRRTLIAVASVLACLLDRASERDRAVRDSPAESRRRAGHDRSAVSHRHGADGRRPRARGLVRAVAQRGGRDLVPDPDRQGGARPDARPARLRRPADGHARL